MSFNNALPAWLFTPEFFNAFEAMKANEITVDEFYNLIKDIDEVPSQVKENWKGKSS